MDAYLLHATACFAKLQSIFDHQSGSEKSNTTESLILGLGRQNYTLVDPICTYAHTTHNRISGYELRPDSTWDTCGSAVIYWHSTLGVSFTYP